MKKMILLAACVLSTLPVAGVATASTFGEPIPVSSESKRKARDAKPAPPSPAQAVDMAPSVITMRPGEKGLMVPEVKPAVPVVTPSAPVAVNYALSPADQNYRGVIGRWAKLAGWKFETEHWAAPRDIPIVGSDSLGTDFKAAVRVLTSSSELGDMPVKPCFYSNYVVRVVTKASKCDITKE